MVSDARTARVGEREHGEPVCRVPERGPEPAPRVRSMLEVPAGSADGDASDNASCVDVYDDELLARGVGDVREAAGWGKPRCSAERREARRRSGVRAGRSRRASASRSLCGRRARRPRRCSRCSAGRRAVRSRRCTVPVDRSTATMLDSRSAVTSASDVPPRGTGERAALLPGGAGQQQLPGSHADPCPRLRSSGVRRGPGPPAVAQPYVAATEGGTDAPPLPARRPPARSSRARGHRPDERLPRAVQRPGLQP